MEMKSFSLEQNPDNNQKKKSRKIPIKKEKIIVPIPVED